MGSDHVVLTDWSFNGQSVLGDVGAECPVRSVYLPAMWTEVRRHGKFDLGYDDCADSSRGPNFVCAREKYGGFTTLVREQVIRVEVKSPGVVYFR